MRNTATEVMAGRGVEYRFQNVVSLSGFDKLNSGPTVLLNELLASTSAAALFTLRINRYEMLQSAFAGLSADQLAAQIEDILHESLRETDLAIHRQDDEFIVLLTDIATEKDIEEVAQRLIASCAYLEVYEGYRIPCCIDIGMARYPVDSRTAEDLLRFSGIALHNISQTRQGTALFYTDHQQALHSRKVNMTGELLQAMQDERIELHYQPIYCVDSDEMIALEALVRMRTPEGGLVPPDQFIETAEQTGLIIPLGNWIINQACQQLATWHKAGARVTMSVNVSPVQLEDASFLGNLKRAVATSGLDYRYIELEIIERQEVEPGIESVLTELRRLGVSIAVDDFGTGYASLANLARFPLDVVKVDQSFVRNMLDSVVSRSIVSAIFAMAAELNIKVIAEGVETREQEDYLRSLGCKVAQGFGYARPMQATVLDEAILRGKGKVNRELIALAV
ncbi:MAG: EAL domain-containing protein [Pseudomonadales bacterium]|nr:EAL domain-containing protein [Pseudomonadales bacterium]